MHFTGTLEKDIENATDWPTENDAQQLKKMLLMGDSTNSLATNS